jgi:hypothetical protein
MRGSKICRGGFMLANIDFTDRYRTNPPSPPEDLKWVLYLVVQDKLMCVNTLLDRHDPRSPLTHLP